MKHLEVVVLGDEGRGVDEHSAVGRVRFDADLKAVHGLGVVLEVIEPGGHEVGVEPSALEAPGIPPEQRGVLAGFDGQGDRRREIVLRAIADKALIDSADQRSRRLVQRQPGGLRERRGGDGIVGRVDLPPVHRLVLDGVAQTGGERPPFREPIGPVGVGGACPDVDRVRSRHASGQSLRIFGQRGDEEVEEVLSEEGRAASPVRHVEVVEPRQPVKPFSLG